VGESAVIVDLPWSKLHASVSDLYWQNSVAMDYRTWIAPQIYVPPTFAAYRAGKDSALEAVQSYREESASPAKTASTIKPAANYSIRTIAGTGQRGFSGDGGPAVNSKLNRPCAVAADHDGCLYVADYGNNRIRKISPDGTMTTLAGNGQAGFEGDGGPAVKARLNGPYGVGVDRHGNVFVADQRNNRIRKISRAGAISTLAGNGVKALSGDGGPAALASLAGPDAVIADDQDNVYIADSGNHRIRKVTTDGMIHTIAGTGKGYSGDGGPALQARLNLPAALALDRAGNLYIGDFQNHVVRRIGADGTIATVAGTGTRGFNGDGMAATLAQLNEPGGLGITPSGELVIADGVNFRVRLVDADGNMHTIAGTGRKGDAPDSDCATEAPLFVLDILSVDAQGNIFITDHGNSRIRKLTPCR
jgi:sugar lactone lactonase YvrE